MPTSEELLELAHRCAAKLELEASRGPEGWETLLDEARDEMRTEFGGDPVRFPGYTWLVTATNPG